VFCLVPGCLEPEMGHHATNMDRHLRRHHRGAADPALKAYIDGLDHKARQHDLAAPGAATLGIDMWQRQQAPKLVNVLVLKMIVADLRPLSALRTDAFIDMMSGISGKYVPPSKETVNKTLARWCAACSARACTVACPRHCVHVCSVAC
jgi:hypothetical protein